MDCVMFFVFLVVVLCSNVSYAQLEDECYFAMFNKGTEPCSDFENERLICSLDIEIVPKSDDEDGGIMLTGEMDIKEDLGEEYEIELNVWKEVGSTKEYMYSIEGNLCDSLKMNNTPWKPFVEALQTTDCPVLKGFEIVYHAGQVRIGRLHTPLRTWRTLRHAGFLTMFSFTVKGVYKVDKLRMSLDFAKPFMKSEFCGNYVVDMSMRQISDKMTCYEIGLEIEEGSC